MQTLKKKMLDLKNFFIICQIENSQLAKHTIQFTVLQTYHGNLDWTASLDMWFQINIFFNGSTTNWYRKKKIEKMRRSNSHLFNE